MEEKFIQLKKRELLKIGIKDENGKDTGNYLEFDIEDIELPSKINESDYKHRKNIEWLKNELIILDKKKDFKGKDLLTAKQKEQLRIEKEFYKKEEEALELFLGKDAVKKILNGGNYYYTMYADIMEIIEPIIPLIKEKCEEIKDKIINKYKNNSLVVEKELK